MIRFFSKLAVITLIGVGAWGCSSEAGGSQPVTEERIEAAFIANSVPQIMADCLAERLVDELNNGQLLQIEAMASQDEADRVGMSSREALKPFERLDDKGAKNAILLSHARCKISIIGEHHSGF